MINPDFVLNLFSPVFVSAEEFIDTARSIDKFHLAGIERMRSVRNFHLVYRISNTVYIDSFLGIDT